MENKPLLSICIPTYNRVEQIQKQIRLLLPQLTNEVKLVVYDNHSKVPVVELFSHEELTQFTIVRNLANVGGDANIARCFENCETKWLWVLSDDDFIKNDALKTVLHTLKVSGDVLWINFDNAENVVLNNFEEFINDNNKISKLSDALWISKSIHNIQLEREYIQYQYKYLSSMYGQVIIVLKYLEHNQEKNIKMVRVRTSLFSFNDPNISWNYYDYIRLTNVLFEAFDGDVLRKMKKTILKTLSKFCIANLSHLKVSKRQQIYLFKLIALKLGRCNIYKYCIREYLIFHIHIMLPNRIEVNIRKILKK